MYSEAVSFFLFRLAEQSTHFTEDNDKYVRVINIGKFGDTEEHTCNLELENLEYINSLKV